MSGRLFWKDWKPGSLRGIVAEFYGQLESAGFVLYLCPTLKKKERKKLNEVQDKLYRHFLSRKKESSLISM